MRKFKTPRYTERFPIMGTMVIKLLYAQGLVYNSYSDEYDERIVVSLNAQWHVIFDVKEARNISEAIRMYGTGHLELVPVDPESNIKYLKKVI